MANLLTRVLRRLKRHSRPVPPSRRNALNDQTALAPASEREVARVMRAPKEAPQTMDALGLRFLELLAAQKTRGVFLEVGPLFGSSTNAIARGRGARPDPIHTIDTFTAQAWVHDRFGFDLSRELFDRYTAAIENLHVHQGFAPVVVRDRWKEEIGFYFDDATHGDPGWSANYDFFSRFFADDCLICGDDYAIGWPDIIRNVQKLTDEMQVTLYVMGRVWAYTRQNAERIEAAIHAAAPALAGARISTTHKDVTRSLPAASWSYGLFRRERMSQFSVDAGGCFAGQIRARRADGRLHRAKLDGTQIKAWELAEITCDFDRPIQLDLCLAGQTGRSRKIAKPIPPGETFTLPEGSRIVGLRLIEPRNAGSIVEKAAV